MRITRGRHRRAAAAAWRTVDETYKTERRSAVEIVMSWSDGDAAAAADCTRIDTADVAVRPSGQLSTLASAAVMITIIHRRVVHTN